MPELLSPTVNVPRYENNGTRGAPIPASDTALHNIVDTNRVTRSDERTERQDTGAMRYESNFSTFVQRMRATGELSETFLAIMRQLQISSGINDGISGQLAEFLEFLKMDEAQLVNFIKNQSESSSRFGGALFQSLKNAYISTQSETIRNSILQFLRKFSDYSSTARLETRMTRTIFDMSESMLSSFAERMLQLGAQLENGIAAGDRAGNINLIQNEVITLMSLYVKQTHDQGRARALLSMLVLDLVRYANGDKKEMLQSFRALAEMNIINKELAELSDTDSLRILMENSYAKAADNDEFARKFSKLLNSGISNSANPSQQAVFTDMLFSVLFNESVYMPLKHLMVPLDWHGTPAFSEIWIDPDSQRGSNGYQKSDPMQRVLIKMEIDQLGAFDVIITHQSGMASLQVACPKAIASQSQSVSKDLAHILTRNSLTVGSVNVTERKRPVTISEAFPGLFEKMEGVNVKI